MILVEQPNQANRVLAHDSHPKTPIILILRTPKFLASLLNTNSFYTFFPIHVC